MRLVRFYVGFCKKTAIAALGALLTIGVLTVFTVSAEAVPSGVFPDKYAAIVIDANNGRVLFADKADMRRYPASLTKMMTLYLLFDAMKARRIAAGTPIPVSAYANSQPPTKLNLGVGRKIGAEAAAKALITKSANDIAVAIAEYLGGSEKNFARMMTMKARQLGMRRTNFTNASGLPDMQNYSTARDLAILALALQRHFPDQYALFSTTNFVHQGRLIRGHNRLVANMAGVDGIKTGYTRMSGFNLASSRHIGNKSLVAVVLGGKSSALRDSQMAGLLTRYMDKAGGKKDFNPAPAAPAETPVLMAALAQGDKAKPAAAGRAAAIPVPTVKMTADKTGGNSAQKMQEDKGRTAPLSAPAAVMSDREWDSALLMMLASQSVNEPQQKAAIAALDKAVLPAAGDAQALDNIVTASVPAAGGNKQPDKGWIIQLAASKNLREAEHILTRATRRVHKIYAAARPYTEKFTKSGTPYYRVRFGGFTSITAARNTCALLKKDGYHCLAAAGSAA
ncbi:MAG: D-alanyl-D-alanine carboxypeptidase [Candidatus Tokpelaia sp.]|nr:MAG: D-alanyl-D-alanine carboxypeptidase [Candidatus Tokpelaia sp.]KAA6207739.1 MAG: D-alanyl-D-alanine carboxypeptidase [Candidatus Tokpelaia sp.]